MDLNLIQNNLPQSWALIELEDLVENPKKDIVDGPFGSNLKANEYTDSGIPVFKIQNIKANQFINKNINYIKKEKAKELHRHSFKSGDLIITKLGNPLGLCCKVPDTYNYGIIVADLMRLRPSIERVFDKYVIHAINSFFIQNQFKAITKGTTRPRVNLTIVRNIKVPYPPLPEQHQIVAKIEELFSELDNGIESLKKAREQLKTYRQAVLKYAFEGKLTKEWREKNKPAIWQEMKLGDLIKVKSGNGLTKVHQVDTGNHLVYGGNGIMGKHNKYMFEEPKLIIGRVGVHCGNVHITKPTSWVTDNAFVTNFDNDQVGMKYLLYFIFDLNLKKYSSSTAQPVISGGKIYPIDVTIPGKAEQQIIVSEIESRLSVCDKIEQTIEESLKKAEALRQSILKKAFGGELTRDWREKHPELITGENSAEKLLGKIKAEKAHACRQASLSAVGRKKARPRKTKKK